MRMLTRAVTTATAVLALAACGQSSGTQQTTTTPPAQGSQPAASGSQPAAQSAQQVVQGAQQGAQSLAQGLTQMAQGLKAAQTDANGKAITPVDFEKLVDALPSPAGWERSKPEGRETTSPFASSVADAHYTKGTSHADVTLTDAALSQMFMMPFTMMMSMTVNERSTSGYKKTLQYGTQPGMEEWNSDNKHGEMTAVVDKRIVVQVVGNGLDSMDTLKSVFNAIDLNKIASLK